MGIGENVGEKIKGHREGLGLTQKEAADALGVSLRTWQAWEAGTAFPQPRFRRALDAFLTRPIGVPA